MKLGWGMVSTGRASDVLMGPAVNAAADSHVVAVFSREQDKGEAYAAKHGGKAYTSYSDMLEDKSVDVVYIASPNALHAEQAIEAAKAGKHIFCEKPLAMNSNDARRVVKAAKDAGVKLGTDFQTRHYAANEEAVKLIRDGAIGKVMVMQIESCAGANPLKGWRTDPALAGMGSVNNIAVHPLDLARYFAGSEATEVVALTDVGRSDTLETISLLLVRFENGALAYINGSQATPNPRADMEIYGSSGRITGRNTTRPFLEGELLVLSGSDEKTIPFNTKDGFQRAVAAFNRAVIDDTEPNPSGEDGARSVELVEAITKSARTGQVVKL
ncbi:MAG TPA: Gfo/Idh/MocA family oxidoreductase [Candidatus Dormibacteraeota bacterium]|nr:Gfo/Idh/MocA family oxidoreductase [Candidatus Dormibacteraeota bacterium]